MTAVCSVADVRNNKYTLPKDKLLDKKSIVAAFSISNFKGGKGMTQVVEVMKYVFAAMGDAIGACPFLSEFRNSFLERPMS